MLKHIVVAVGIAALTLGLTACGGSSTTVKPSGTQGQQLMDLKEAYDKGVISEKEYNATRKKILKD